MKPQITGLVKLYYSFCSWSFASWTIKLLTFFFFFGKSDLSQIYGPKYHIVVVFCFFFVFFGGL